MRIETISGLAITTPRERPAATAAPKPRDPAAVVSLGESATAAAAAPADPGVTTRIARIRELLDGGNYVVDLDKLSERILDDDAARSTP